MKAPINFLDKNISNTMLKDKKACENMFPPHLNNHNIYTSHTLSKQGNGTEELLKWIADVTIKRRQIRRKFRCSNLLAEAVLSNSIREAKRELAQKQEEKRRNLQNFHYNYNVTVTYSPVEASTNNNSLSNYSSFGQDAASDQALQSCLSSLDSFFNELKDIKA